MVWQRVTLNQPLTAQDVSFVVNGETSLSEVVEKLGAPNQMLSSNGGVVARYQFTDGRYFRVDFGWGLRFLIPFYSPELVLGGGGLGTDAFRITASRFIHNRLNFGSGPSRTRLHTLMIPTVEIARIAGSFACAYNSAP